MANVRKYGYFRPFVPNNRVRLPVKRKRPREGKGGKTRNYEGNGHGKKESKGE